MILDIAKSMIRSTALSAMKILPFAALTVSAYATTSFEFSTGSCGGYIYGVNESPTGSVAAESLPTSNGIRGLKIYTPIQCSISSASGVGGQVSLEVDVTIEGTLAEGTVIPLHVSFIPYADQPGDINVSLELISHPFHFSVFEFEVPSGALVSRSFDVTFSEYAPFLDQFLVGLRLNHLTASSLQLFVPQDSIDVNAINEVPEPGSLLLLTPAAAWLFLRRRAPAFERLKRGS